jgi:hypothetical protein
VLGRLGSALNKFLFTLRITGFFNFVHPPVFKKHKRIQRFGNWTCYRTQLRGGTDPVSETLCSLEYRTMDKSEYPVILSVVDHRQNPLEFSHICVILKILDIIIFHF